MTNDYSVTNTVVAGRGGDIAVRDYVPATATEQLPFLWVHGGGFALGGLDMVESDAPARYLAARGRMVRTLHYRLAPNIGPFKNPRLGAAPGRYPEAHQDVVDVAESLRALAGPIAIGGASAGANLAAGALLALRDEGEWMPQSAVMAYGAFHSVLPENLADTCSTPQWRGASTSTTSDPRAALPTLMPFPGELTSAGFRQPSASMRPTIASAARVTHSINPSTRQG
jgi:acetyl esterase/lipase